MQNKNLPGAVFKVSKNVFHSTPGRLSATKKKTKKEFFEGWASKSWSTVTNLMEAAMEVFNDSKFQLLVNKQTYNQTFYFDIYDTSKMFYQAVFLLLWLGSTTTMALQSNN